MTWTHSRRHALPFCALLFLAILGSCTNGTPQASTFWPASPASTASWNTVGGVGFSPGAVGSSKIAIAPNGELFTEFVDWNVSGALSVETYDTASATWKIVGAEGFTTAPASYDVLAIDSTGVPYVAFRDNGSGRLVVMTFDGSSWHVPTGSPAFASPGNATDISLVVDMQGRPCVAYSESSGTTVVRWNPSTMVWDTLGSSGFSTPGSSNNSIALDAAGNLYVAYEDASAGNQLTARKYNVSTATWDLVGISGFSSSSGTLTCLKIGPDNVPYVAFVDQGVSSGAITVMKFISGAWVLVGNRGFSPGQAWDPSLAISPGGILYVGFHDSSSTRAMVMKFTGTEWAYVGPSGGISAGDMQGTSLAVDSAGNLDVGYRDNFNSSRLTVLSSR